MRATWHDDGRVWKLRFNLEPEDQPTGQGQGTMQVALKATEAHVRLPRRVAAPHPDLQAAAALSIVRPWVRQRLTMNAAVSPLFAETVHRLMAIEVAPVDPGLTPRAPGTQPLLCYSGGSDSVAASELLPEGTPHVHLRRSKHPRVPNRATHVRADAMEEVVKRTAERQRWVEIVQTDLEYLCHPYPTLPNWFAITIGCLLMADELEGGALGMGGTLAAHYMDMGRRWTGARGRGLEELGENLGLPFLRPALGATEVITTAITLRSDLSDIARSCVLGNFTTPCYQCTKCVRKELLSAAVGSTTEPLRNLEKLSPRSPGLREFDGPPPYYMQAQLEFALSRLDVRGTLLDTLKQRLAPDPTETEWMWRYFEPALEHGVPAPWRQIVRDRLTAHVEFMHPTDIVTAQAWSR